MGGLLEKKRERKHIASSHRRSCSCDLTRFMFCRTKKRGVLLEITMHLAAVVLILVVAGIAKGNLRFWSVPRDLWQRHKEVWVNSCKKKPKQNNKLFVWADSLCAWKESITDEYFITLNVLCVLFFLKIIIIHANTASVSQVGNAAQGATRKMGFVRSRGSAGTVTTSDSCVDDGLIPRGALQHYFHKSLAL